MACEKCVRALAESEELVVILQDRLIKEQERIDRILREIPPSIKKIHDEVKIARDKSESVSGLYHDGQKILEDTPLYKMLIRRCADYEARDHVESISDYMNTLTIYNLCEKFGSKATHEEPM